MSPALTVSILVFYISIVSSLFFLNVSKSKGWFLKPNQEDIPYVGGIGMFIGITVGVFLLTDIYGLKLLAASIPVFVLGLLEHSEKQTGFILRTFLMLISAAIFVFVFGFKMNMHFVSSWLIKTASMIIILAVLYIFKILINTKEALFALMIFIILAILAYFFSKHGEKVAFETALIASVSLLGVIILKYPLKKILLGNGVAYVSGVIITSLLFYALQ